MLELKNVNAYSISLLPNDITIRSTTKIYGNAFTHLLLVLGSLTLSARCTCISRLLSNCTIIFSKVLVSSFFFFAALSAVESAVEAILIQFTVMSNVLESIFKIAI